MPRRVRRANLALLLILLVPLASLTPVGRAHGDRSFGEARVALDPGESMSWIREVHWHRLMGTVEATGPVTVSVQGPDGRSEAAGPGASLRVDHLVACCRTATWTPHTVEITNTGDAPVEVTYDLVLLHDNLAVTADDAEPGAWWQTLAIVGLMIGIPAWRARQPALEAPAGPWLRSSRILHGTAWGIGGLLALVGMARFSTGPLTGTLGATAWFPLDLVGFFNTHSLVMMAVMGVWGAGLACWAGARRRAGSPAAYRVDGLLFAVGSLVIGGLMVAELGRWIIPVILGLAPAAAILADVRIPRRAGDAEP